MRYTRFAVVPVFFVAVISGAALAAELSVYGDPVDGRLLLAKSTAMSARCGLTDEATRVRALTNLRNAIKHLQTEGLTSETDVQIQVRFDAAVSEGGEVSADVCDRYRRRPDIAAHQAEFIEMLAYGGDPKPR